MHLTVLGRYSPYPAPGGVNPGYLVSAGESRVLLDCGSGVVARLTQACPMEELTAAVITHLHPDHSADLVNLAFAALARTQAGHPRLLLYLPPGGREVFDGVLALMGDLGRLCHQGLEVVEYAAGRSLEVGSLELGFFPTEHGMNCHGVRLRGTACLVYSGDSAAFPGLAEGARGADLFLCEATTADTELARRARHLTGAEAGAAAREAGVAGLLLTHFPPGADLEAKAAAAREAFGGPVEIAREQHTVPVGGS